MPSHASRRRQRVALKEARRAAESAPNDELAWRALAEAALEQNAPEQAAEALARAAELADERGAYLRALSHLRLLRTLGSDVASVRARVRRRFALAVGCCVLSATLLALAAPPLDLWPLALVGLIPLLHVVRAVSPGAAFGYGWLCGLVTNLYGFSWGMTVLARFAHVPSYAGAAITLLVCAYQALVFGLAVFGAALLARRFRLSWFWAAPLCFALAEAVVPMLFPWYLAICVWRAWPLLQVAELGGPLAVSALIVLINLIVMSYAQARARREPAGRPLRLAAAVAVLLVGAGLARAGHIAFARRHAEHLRIGIVQPNFGILGVDDRKLHGEAYIATLRTQTAALGERGATVVVWPETMFPFYFDRELEREFAPTHPWELRGGFRGQLLIGVLTHRFSESLVYNSAVLISADGRITGRYDKNRLVAFGEYIPFAGEFPDWADRMRKRMPDTPDIAPGKHPSVLADGTLRVAPLICYEDILPDYVQEAARLRPHPNLLVTLANHAWFGALAPREALAQATLRSVETRRDLLRAANTGVSSFGDALGRVSQVGPLFDVPRDQPMPPTPLLGDVALMESFALGPYAAPLFPYLCAALLAGSILRQRRKGSRT